MTLCSVDVAGMEQSTDGLLLSYYTVMSRVHGIGGPGAADGRGKKRSFNDSLLSLVCGKPYLW